MLKTTPNLSNIVQKSIKIVPKSIKIRFGGKMAGTGTFWQEARKQGGNKDGPSLRNRRFLLVFKGFLRGPKVVRAVFLGQA